MQDQDKENSFEEFIKTIQGLDHLFDKDEVEKWVDVALAKWLVPQEPVDFHLELRELMVKMVRESHTLRFTFPMCGYIAAILNKTLEEGAMTGVNPTLTMLHAFFLGFALFKTGRFIEPPEEEGGGD